jgi:filamentous hemagglutinin family protein
MKKAYLILLNFIIFSLFSNPINEKILLGEVNIQRRDNILNIDQLTNNAIIEWGDFSILENEITNFNMLSSNFSVLNKVTSNNVSNIFGQLLSNGNVFLINQNGIFIGKDAFIDTNSFFASTLNLKNEDFLNPKNMNLESKHFAKFINLGNIKTNKNIHIISQEIENNGSLTSHDTHLIGANNVFLYDLESNVIIKTDSIGAIDNQGVLDSINTQIEAFGNSAYSLAINQNGIIKNTKFEISNGKVLILADNINISENAYIDLSSNQDSSIILIGGDYKGENPDYKNAKSVYVDSKAIIKADGIDNSNGGKIIIFSDENTSVYGTITAKGGENKGDGGFVEISSKNYLDFKGVVFASAYNGKKGTLLLDPSNITISNSAATNMNLTGTDPKTYSPTGDNSLLLLSDILSVINSGTDLIITTTGAGTQDGDINFLSPIGAGDNWSGLGNLTLNSDRDINIKNNIIWSSNTLLSLNANRSIYVIDNVTIQNTHSGSGNFSAIDFKANKQLTPTAGNFTGIRLNQSTLSSVEGNISLQGKSGNTNQTSGIEILHNSLIESTGSGINAATITLDGIANIGSLINIGIKVTSSTISSIDGNINVAAATSSNGNMGYALLLEQSSNILSANDAAITLNCAVSSAIDNSSAVFLVENSNITSNNGNIDITANNDFASDKFNLGLKMMAYSKINSTGSGDVIVNATTTGASFNDAISLDGSFIENNLGAISLTATSNATNDYNDGISLNTFSKISSTTSDATLNEITINATSGTGSHENFGLNINYSDITSVSSNINITATSRGSNSPSYGSFIGNISKIESTGIDANAANITINGTGGNSDYGTYKDDISTVSSAMGDVTIIGTKNW